MRRVRLSALLIGLIAILALVAAGCGGSDDEGGGATTDTAPAANRTLSQASWDSYETEAKQAQSVNQKAIKTFSRCRDLIVRNMQSQQILDCFGNTTSQVVTEGQQFLATLGGLDGEAGGACAKALTNYEGYVKLYVSSVNALDTGTGGADSVPSAAQVDEAKGALARARTASTAFAAACKPS